MNDVCRFCGADLSTSFVDLGLSPLANEYVSEEQLKMGQHFYPLHVKVCEKCFYTQTMEYKSPENIFKNYQYFSSYSTSWLAHAKQYCDMIIERCHLTKSSLVAEAACNDGYLLQYFLERNIPCYGIEPAENVAYYAEQKGIKVYREFFCGEFARKMVDEKKKVDLLIGNNVLAHVPDINSFIEGIRLLLKEDGIATFEFPHLQNLIKENQFDTIYHEHFAYLSITFLTHAMDAHELKICDAEKLTTHGGSLRIYVAHKNSLKHEIKDSVRNILDEEIENGLNSVDTYRQFSEQVKRTKRNILQSIIALKDGGARIAAYGAAAKGNTLLNYCGIGKDIIDYVVDVNPHKQGLFLPGTQIPIVSQDYLKQNSPDYLLILPWNLKDEIIAQLSVLDLHCKYVTLIPEFKLVGEREEIDAR